MQIIQKINYPNSCRLELIIVPNEFYPDVKYFQSQINHFEQFKQRLSEFDVNKRRHIINQMIHDVGEYDKCIVQVLTQLLLNARNNLLQPKYLEQLNNDEKLQTYCDNIFQNIMKTKIRVLRLCDLCSRGVDPAVLESVVKCEPV